MVFGGPKENEVRKALRRAMKAFRAVAHVKARARIKNARERVASIKQMATDANWQALKKEVTQNTDSVVDQATAKFTQLELQARAQFESAQQIIAAAKQEFADVKRVIDGTADSLH